jgi:tetratricopeptide (TPR) repeat protein
LADLAPKGKKAKAEPVEPEKVVTKPVQSETSEPKHSLVRVSDANEEQNDSIPPPANLTVRDAGDDLAALKLKFDQFVGYETALQIAEILYGRKVYDEASQWARRANMIDRDDERAWILYAKSEYAMGHKERAMRILTIFLDYKESKAARGLLAQWSTP